MPKPATTGDPRVVSVTIPTAGLLPMWVLPCPFNEGKTASGQVEMSKLYHRISVLPEGLPYQQRPGDFYCGSAA
jgi:hypothetical protein